jgi:hypothetical protein
MGTDRLCQFLSDFVPANSLDLLKKRFGWLPLGGCGFAGCRQFDPLRRWNGNVFGSVQVSTPRVARLAR